jgi:BirA family biotin operon repressor/biotin-[acetyl-CoA-carboxylase] ligase
MKIPIKNSRMASILAMLEEAGDWCSGEELAARLGISRAAVGQYVSVLRAHGHGIAARSRRGYCLRIKADSLTEARVRPLLKTRYMGRKAWRCFDETHSTNREAVFWALEGAESGSLALAERQFAGRGRRGHSWFSTPRSLHCSIILLREEFSGARPPLLMTAASLAAAEAVACCTALPAKVKLPNDVYIAGRKVCGTLVELGLRGGEAEWAVIGIGCNMNALVEDFPEELRQSSTSLLLEGGVPVDRSVFLAALLERLEFWIEQARVGNKTALRTRWNALSLRA